MTDMARVLVVEDDAEIADTICAALAGQGHEVVRETNGRDALQRAEAERFDVITLDRMLPGLDGLTVLSRLRARDIATPVLVISALGDVDDRIDGLRAGGDDYLTKPFAASEMAMRVEVLLRRAREFPEEGLLRAGELEMDLIKRKVWLAGEPIPLLQKEFRLLEFLMRHQGQVVNRRVIFEQVWGRYFDPTDNLINVHIGKLRRKLEKDGQAPIIQTIKGEGYRLDVA